jgi:hypothetical protein
VLYFGYERYGHRINPVIGVIVATEEEGGPCKNAFPEESVCLKVGSFRPFRSIFRQLGVELTASDAAC